MSNEVYPVLPGLTFGTERKYAFKTEVQEAMSGAEVRQSWRAYPVRSWALRYEFLRQNLSRTEWSQLVGFFMRHKGRLDDFLFEDPNDNTAVNESLGTGNGTKTQFQLIRRIDGFIEPIYSPKAIQQARVNGTPTGAYTLNSASGVITFSSAPPNGHPVAADFTYYWRCRFEDDTLSLREFVRKFFEAQRIGLKYCPP